MAVPFRKVSKTRKRMRRAHNALEAKTVTSCPNCGEMIKPHRVCKNCGYYKKEEMAQNHNALDDALLLKYVFEQVQEHDEEFDAFPEYKAQKVVAKTENKPTTNGDIIIFRIEEFLLWKILMW